MRRSVFYPTEHHIDFITVSGFELCQAATPRAPPTADQPGLIGPNWAKGWVIEDNVIHDAKCVAISIGKEVSTGDNNYTHRGDKPGYQYQLESVFSAQQIGWDKEHIGSHVIRRNTIYDCGQCAIAGHLGCVFSTIEDNHIHRIALKREFYGHEIAGIKLHAAIDVEITHNRIHSCSLGIWLDWQTQGTRVARNVLYGNSRDLFVEVSHGPYVIDHNLLASPVSIESFSQGGAYVGNLVGGTLGLIRVMDRATPYHRPHSTQVAGYALIYGADDRWIGNVFAGGEVDAAYNTDAHTYEGAWVGTAGYDGHPSTFEAYLALIDAQPPGDHNRFPDVPQAVYIRHNAYAGAALPYAAEDAPLRLDSATFAVVEEGDAVFLEADLPESFDGLQAVSSPARTCPGSVSSTRTSRSVTARPRGSTATCLVRTRTGTHPTRLARLPACHPARLACACGDTRRNEPTRLSSRARWTWLTRRLISRRQAGRAGGCVTIVGRTRCPARRHRPSRRADAQPP